MLLPTKKDMAIIVRQLLNPTHEDIAAPDL